MPGPIPELKQKKIARTKSLAAAAMVAEKKAAADAVAMTTNITNKAKSYEAEYAKVGLFYNIYIFNTYSSMFILCVSVLTT